MHNHADTDTTTPLPSGYTNGFMHKLRRPLGRVGCMRTRLGPTEVSVAMYRQSAVKIVPKKPHSSAWEA